MTISRSEVRQMISNAKGRLFGAKLTKSEGVARIFGVRFGLNVMGFGVTYNPEKFWFRVMNLNKL
jgi:hypothetical protein